MSSSRRPDKGQQASRLLAPSAGRPPRTPGDNTSVCDGRGKSASSGGRAISSQPSGTISSPQGGGDQGYQTPKPAGSARPGSSDPGSDTNILGSDIIAGLTSTGNYVSLKYDPSLGRSKSRSAAEDGTSPGKLTGESKTVVDSHIQVYTNWANHYLSKNSGRNGLISNLQTDLCDGVLLARLIESLVGEKIPTVFDRLPQSSAEALRIIEECFSFLAQRGVNIEGIRPKDIQAGSLRSVLGLLFNLSHYKQQCRQQQSPSSGCSSPQVMTSRSHLQQPATNASATSRVPSPSRNRTPVHNTVDRHHTSDNQYSQSPVTCGNVMDNNNCLSHDTKSSQKVHSSLPRSNNRPTSAAVVQTVAEMNGSCNTVPMQVSAGTSLIQQPPSGSTNRAKNSTSMLDKFKLFGSKSRTEKDNIDCNNSLSIDTPNDVTSKNGLQGNASSPVDGRAPRLPVRNHRESANTVTDTGQTQAPPPGGSKNVSASVSASIHHSSNSSISTSSKISSKVPSRSLPRSQNNNSFRSGRRSVEPVAVIGNVRTPDDPQLPRSSVVHSVPGSRTTSITSLSSDVTTSRADTPRKSSSGNRLPAPASLIKMKTKLSRDNLATSASKSSSKDLVATNSKTVSGTSSLPKSRCQSAPRTVTGVTVASPVVADGNQVATKSQVATVRQLSTDITVDRVPPSSLTVQPSDDITIPSDIISRRPASGSRMPRLTSSNTGRSSTSRSVSGVRDESSSGEPCGAAQPAIPRSSLNESRVSSNTSTNTETGKTSVADIINNSLDGEGTLTRASTATDAACADDVTSIKPMKPMTSLSYLFTSTPLDGSSYSSSSTRLLSANRRPFPSVSVAPTASRAAGTLCSGYVSDGDMSGRNCYNNRYSGYMSEGGASLYATRRTQQSFLESIDGMKQCLERGLADVDDDDDDVDDDDLSDDDIDCSSVTSADIDIAISADEDYTSALASTPSHPPRVAHAADTPLGGACVSASHRRHVAFSTLPFERGSVARATLPSFSSSGDPDLIGDSASMFRRPTTPGNQMQMASSSPQPAVAMTTKQRMPGSETSRCLPLPTTNQRPRSKSVGRNVNGCRVESSITSSGVGPVVSLPLSTSTSNGRSTSSLANTLANSSENTDKNDVMRGERLNNYRKNSLLKFSNTASSSSTAGVSSQSAAAANGLSSSDYANISVDSHGPCSRWSRATGVPTTSGRRSVDSVTQKTWDWSPSITSSSTTIRDGGQEDLIEGEVIGSGISRCRGMAASYFQRRGGNIVTTTNPSSPYFTGGDPTVSLVAGPRPRIQSSSGRSAMSDIEGGDGRSTPSRLSGPYSSGRSLPRNGLSWTSGDPVTSLLTDHLTAGIRMTPGASSSSSGRRPSYGGVSAGGGLYGGCNGLTSHLSASNENLLHGSSLSLGSNSSSIYSTAEEIQAQEIYKLRRELDAAQNKIASLNSHLNTNAHVVFAFEQSLGNMTQRLQRLAAATDQKDSELNEMRSIINSLRQQRGMTSDMMLRPPSEHNAAEQDCPSSSAATIRRHLSSDSVMSAGQQSLSTVSSAGDVDRKKKKHKNWLTSFGKAFSRKKKNDLISDADSDTSSIYADASLTTISPVRLSHALVVPTTPMKHSANNTSLSVDAGSDAAMIALQQELHEKEMRMTDIQLEALSSAHHLQQLKDTISRMKNEMVSLRVDNERLQQLVQEKGIDQLSPSADTCTDTCTDSPSLKTLEQSTSPLLNKSSLESQNIDLSSSPANKSSKDMLLGGATSLTNLQNITLSIQLSSENEVNEILMSKLEIESKTNWESLISVIGKHFKEYIHQLDPGTSLGLYEDSVYCCSIGSVTFGKDLPKPELLPCGYLVGETTNISVTLKGPQQNCVDSLAYDTLVPKSIVQRYVSLLMEHRRIILCGSSGTGKTYMARRLAEHLILRAGKTVNDNEVVTFSVDHKSGRELRQYLSSIADKCDRQQLHHLPHVIILDGLHHVTSPLGDTFNGFLNVDYKSSPYIIGTMNQATGSTTNLQLHHNFRWVLCANHMEPVQGFLGRYLRRRMAESCVKEGADCKLLDRIVQWIQLLWQQLNRLLETHNSTDVTIGPRLFLSCPMEANAVPMWFTDLWNYSIIPYLLEAVREGIQTYGIRAAWEDPVDWVRATSPWSEMTIFDWSALQRIRPEDIGCDGVTSLSVVTSSGLARNVVSSRTGTSADTVDPLMNMLLKLQEAANVSSGSDMTNIDNQELDLAVS